MKRQKRPVKTNFEEVEDKRMARLISEGRKSGLADTNRVLKKLGSGQLFQTCVTNSEQ